MTINILNVLQYHVPSTTNCVVTVAISFLLETNFLLVLKKKKKNRSFDPFASFGLLDYGNFFSLLFVLKFQHL